MEIAVLGIEHGEQTDTANVTSVVHFAGLNDPEDPLIWSGLYKGSIVILISIMSFVV